MKVIFLDIDGVLNCEKTRNPRKFPFVVDKKLLARLKKLVAETGAKVVLSTSWRLDPIGRLAAKHFGVPFYDICPNMPRSSRSKEILAWLKKHPNVTRYAVIDDDDDDLDGLPLFQPSPQSGLTTHIARGVKRYLNGDTDNTMPANIIKRIGENALALLKRKAQ
jgi:Swiss Army Knife RNA repair-like protein